MKNVLVIGATGMIGKPVTLVLLQSEYDITIMARHQQKARSLFPKAKIVYGDVFDPLSLLPVFEGKDIVYISLGPARNARRSTRMPEDEGVENIVAVAQKNFHWWIFDIKQKAVEKVKASGIPYTIFYASTFMESFDQLMMRGSRIMLAGESKALMYFIAAKDYGQQLIRSFALPVTINKEYTVQGPARIVEALNNYPERFESEETWKELGKPSTTLKLYARGIE